MFGLDVNAVYQSEPSAKACVLSNLVLYKMVIKEDHLKGMPRISPLDPLRPVVLVLHPIKLHPIKASNNKTIINLTSNDGVGSIRIWAVLYFFFQISCSLGKYFSSAKIVRHSSVASLDKIP